MTTLATRLDRLIDAMRLGNGTTRQRIAARLSTRLGVSAGYITNLAANAVRTKSTRLDLDALAQMERQYDAALRARMVYEAACRRAALRADLEVAA